MARKKKLDNLSLDMIQCEKDGFGVSYGRWNATQERKELVKDETIPAGWKLCEHCGKPFKPRQAKRFCDEVCRTNAYYESGKGYEQMRRYRERRKAAANG